MAMLNSSSPLDRNLAIDSLVELGARIVPIVIENMKSEEPDTLINCLDILGHTGSEAALPPVLKLVENRHPDSNVRFAAFETMSRLPFTQAPLSLIEGITDPSEQVRIAAATAMNKNPSDILITGLKSKIETGGKRSKKVLITEAIIDSHSDVLFLKLLDSDSFVFLASDYLTGCHEKTVRFFSDLLVKRGSKSLAMTIKENIKEKSSAHPLNVFCVDDSEIHLKYYLKLIHNAGHHPFVFHNPEEALKSMKKGGVNIFITDLNIVGFHGLHLVEIVREAYSKASLSIAVVTTQKDFVDNCHASPSGDTSMDLVDAVAQKPLDLKQMKALLEKLGHR
jgi:PleD family two-component response regulator